MDSGWRQVKASGHPGGSLGLTIKTFNTNHIPHTYAKSMWSARILVLAVALTEVHTRDRTGGANCENWEVQGVQVQPNWEIHLHDGVHLQPKGKNCSVNANQTNWKVKDDAGKKIEKRWCGKRKEKASQEAQKRTALDLIPSTIKPCNGIEYRASRTSECFKSMYFKDFISSTDFNEKPYRHFLRDISIFIVFILRFHPYI